MEAIISNQELTPEEIAGVVVDKLVDELGEELPAGSGMLLNQAATELVNAVRGLGPQANCEIVKLESRESLGEKASCVLTICMDADGRFDIPVAQCNYRCQKGAAGGRQECCCGENSIFDISGISGKLDRALQTCENFNVARGVKL